MATRNLRRERRIARHVRLAASHERALAHDLRKIFARAGRVAAAHVAAGQDHLAVAVVAGFEPAIAKALRARLHVAAMASAELVLEELTGGKALGELFEATAPVFEQKLLSLFDVAERTVLDWLSHHAAEMVQRVSQSLKRLIRGSLKRGKEANEPPRVLARRMRDETGGEIGQKRAIVIARTETHTATQVGSEAAAQATGLALDKEWGATEDARTRPAHAEADGQTVDKNADFTVGGERLRFPGDPRGSAGNIINCRCVALWVPRIPK
ncbi:phage Mu protein F like protein [Methylosinus sp. sav-2]|uniref:phage minor head protein n=1 Tax=Methylosinus sp. sav-2 TaxID=2485168 RepID=UPI00047D5279|nr:phage minor head protein [Methylosinus sp. sav-2]TDX61938.1 phage Mu protein F like protein [Methylosinus sp. sav-2]